MNVPFFLCVYQALPIDDMILPAIEQGRWRPFPYFEHTHSTSSGSSSSSSSSDHYYHHIDADGSTHLSAMASASLHRLPKVCVFLDVTFFVLHFTLFIV
jgi:hypothetical protein